MTKPTVVLVHGAFADASSWSGVITRLQHAGVEAIAIANPLRGIESDSAYLTNFVNQIGGPVLLVGHSYGGALITQSGTDARSVVGLVFVAAFAPDVDEHLSEINARYPEVALGAALRTLTYPVEGGGERTEGFIEHESFRQAFAADLTLEQTKVMAATQRPVSLDAFSTAVHGTAAWRTLQSWAVVATADQAIHPDAEREMALRAGAMVTEVDASHAVAVSQPEIVAGVILSALETVAIDVPNGVGHEAA